MAFLFGDSEQRLAMALECIVSFAQFGGFFSASMSERLLRKYK
jgi:hypothetical protein